MEKGAVTQDRSKSRGVNSDRAQAFHVRGFDPQRLGGVGAKGPGQFLRAVMDQNDQSHNQSACIERGRKWSVVLAQWSVYGKRTVDVCESWGVGGNGVEAVLVIE